MREAVIVDAVRSARGKKKGLHPQELLAKTIQGALNRQKIEPKLIDDVIMGCVTPVGEQGLNIARGAALASGLPLEVPGVTINRFCGSGQQAVHFAAQAVMSGAQDVVFAGGIESMSRVAMGSDAVGNSERNTEGPNSKMILERFPGLVPQGLSAEMVAKKWGITRAECDAFAFESQKRAGIAIEQGRFRNEITVINGATKDEHARPNTTLEALAALQPSFQPEGVVTAGNASGIVDGASVVLVMTAEKAKELGLKPRARIRSMAVIGSEPEIMLTGPMPATQMAVKKAKVSLGDVDLFEVNEAFASVPLAFMKELNVPHDKVNVNGGAIALGHPLGATGGMLFATLINELERSNKTLGVVTMCIGYGMGTATVIERI
jgi:acetyl-CoA acyltransferase